MGENVITITECCVLGIISVGSFKNQDRKSRILLLNQVAQSVSNENHFVPSHVFPRFEINRKAPKPILQDEEKT